MRPTYMITTENEKEFHKKKTVDALDRMKSAVKNEDLNDADREQSVASYHLDEMARPKSDEENKTE
jgi:hypothetical protein